MASQQQSVEQLFGAVLDCRPEDRSAFLDERCADAPELRLLIEELLLADERAGSFLSKPLLTYSATELSNTLGVADRRDGGVVPGVTEELRRGCFDAGQIIAGRFTINQFIARGGMGEVYEAWDSELKERVALKAVVAELACSTDVLERFKREVKQTRAISHPNVCRVHELFSHESGVQGRSWFLSMEYLEGITLANYIRHHGPMAPEAALDLVEQMVHGLMAAHALGVIHRDFKTSNVMLVSHGSGWLRAVITDFGLALNVYGSRNGLEEPGGQGTPEFMSPEQRATGEVTSLTDQYALGVVMCELLTGSRPRLDESIPSTSKTMVKLPEGELPLRWKRVIARCLETQPADRFKSLEEILTALRPPRRTLPIWVPLVAAAVLIAAVLGVWYSSRTNVQAATLAVLPLQNRTGDANLDYLGAGISEALTNDLSRMPGLQVAAQSISSRYRGESVDPRSAGITMHVRSIVDGSVASSTGSLRVPIELVDVKTGNQVWGQTYEGSVTGIADLQHQISTDVAYRLKIKLDASTKERLKRQYSTNSETYDAYLRGRFELGKRSPDALERAITEFQRALDHDTQYAPAYAGLADCYSLMAFYGMEKAVPLLNKAMTASQQALELDSTLGEAYTSRALARTLLNYDWQGAENDYKRAIELNPAYLTAHTWYGLLVLTPLGRRAEAVAQLNYTQASDPDSLVTTMSRATLDHFAGDFDKSIYALETLVPTSPPLERAVQLLAFDYLAKDMNDQAIVLLEAQPQTPEVERQRSVPLGMAYARKGQKGKASAKLEEAEASVRNGDSFAYETAALYAAMNDREHALDMLELAYNKREANLIFLDVDPLIASLRTEPRFTRLRTRMNIQ